MSERLTRTHHSPLEIRADGRTIVGTAVPFDIETTIAEAGRTYTEVFRRGAFARTITERGAEKVKLLALHNLESLPLGRCSLLREDADGLHMEAHVSATRSGDEVLELVRDGALDGLSIGFRTIATGDRWNNERTRVERTEVGLAEISVVAWGAYPGAVIAGVRTQPHLPAGVARRRLDLLQRSF